MQRTPFLRPVAAIVALAVLAGCAAPGTPGAGVGEGYTPLIDTQNLDMARYQSDMEQCREYSRTISPGRSAVAGVLVGAVVGAAIGAAVGGRTRWRGDITRNTAAVGATSGGLHAASGATVKQEVVIANCMAGRGYRTLDAGIPANPAAPSPYLNAATSTQQPAAGVVVVAQQSESQPVARKTGKDTYQAEQLAKDQSCAATPVASLSASGPGFEVYTVPCTNDNLLTMRCEFGSCRVLQ